MHSLRPRRPASITGNGNFFSPIVHDLDKAVAFYRDGLGLETQGEPGNADKNEALRNMFGLPNAKIRWMIARPGGMRNGVEIVEISGAGGKALERRPQDSGAFTLIVFVRDIDATLARLKAQGAPIVSAGGAPAVLPNGPGHTARMVVVKDPDGHFVEIVQPDEPPKTEAPATANVVDVRVRLTVEDVEKSVRLYHDALGMELTNKPAFGSNATVGAALGVGAGRAVPLRDAEGADHGPGVRGHGLQRRRSENRARRPQGSRLDAIPDAGARYRRRRRRVHEGRRHLRVDRRQTARIAGAKRRAEGRHRARAGQSVRRADPVTAAGTRAGEINPKTGHGAARLTQVSRFARVLRSRSRTYKEKSQ